MTDKAKLRKIEYLTFSLGSEEYGVPIRSVQEIREFTPSTRIASAERHVLGVHNLRGVVIPVIDMRIRLGFAPAYDTNTATIIMTINGLLTGVVVDGVSDVVSLADDEILPVPRSVSGSLDSRYILGLGTAGARMLILADLNMLLGEQDCPVHLAA